LLEGINAYKEAVDVYVQAEMWDAARRLVIQEVPEYGDALSAKKLAFYEARSDWLKCLDIAGQMTPEMVSKYAGLYASDLIKANNFIAAIEAFNKHGANTTPLPTNIPIYRNLVKEVFAANETQDEFPPTLLEDLKDLLLQLVVGLKNTHTATEATINEFERYSVAAFYNYHRITCQKNELKDITAKLAVSLLRYSGDIPADKAFYNAGMACKEVGWSNMAFVFLNRFLDLTEAMEEGDVGILENSDFEGTDVPYDIPLPLKQYLAEDKREEVRNWILAASLDHTMDQSLSTRPCEQCGTDIYISSLVCGSCKTQVNPCVISGYPVINSHKVSCKGCAKPANKEDWNKYVLKMKSCPWCGSIQSPVW